MTNANQVNVDRHGLEVLPPPECWQLLASTPIGRVAFVDAGEPLIFPVTHGVHGGTIVFRSGSGTKLEAAAMERTMAFEVDGWDATRREGWSVLVRGVGEAINDDDDVVETLSRLAVEPWLTEATTGTWVRIRVDEITGRRL